MGRGLTIALTLVAGVAGFVLTRSIDVPTEAKLSVLLPVALATVIGYPIGWLLGIWLSRDADVDSNGYRAVAWSNLIAWLLPVAGMVLSAATWRFSRKAETSTGLYQVLSTVGGLLAMDNAGYAGIASPGVTLASSERSWPRCQFALVERWSSEDIRTHCKDHQPTAAEIREFERLAKEHEQQAAG